MALRIASGKLRSRNGRLAIVSGGGSEPPNGGTVSLTLTDIDKNQRVFQRVGTSKHIAVSGSYTGSAPASIEARVVDATTGTAMSAWATLTGLSIANGLFSGLLEVPQGGWYKLQVRAPANGGSVVSGLNKWGVGIIIGLIGQSNVANLPSTGYLYPLASPLVVNYEASVFSRFGNVNDAFAPNTLFGSGGYSSSTNMGRRGDGYVFLANLVSQGLNVPVCLVERAVGGSSIARWMTGGDCWNSFASAVSDVGGDCEIVVIQIGETDADTMPTATMVARLGDLHGQLKALTNRTDATLHFGVVSLGIGSYNGSSEGEFGNMRAAQVQFANNTPGAFLATAAHDTYTGDGVHINGAGFNVMYRRVPKSILSRFGVGVSGSGPRITAVTRNGTQVDVTVTHAGGTALTDGAGGSGSALTGFEFLDSGVPLAYTGSAILNANTIRFTLASAPTGTLTMSYAMMNCPHSAGATSAPTAASIVYDNAKYHEGKAAPFGLGAIGCPLQPSAAMTVTGG